MKPFLLTTFVLIMNAVVLWAQLGGSGVPLPAEYGIFAEALHQAVSLEKLPNVS